MTIELLCVIFNFRGIDIFTKNDYRTSLCVIYTPILNIQHPQKYIILTSVAQNKIILSCRLSATYPISFMDMNLDGRKQMKKFKINMYIITIVKPSVSHTPPSNED